MDGKVFVRMISGPAKHIVLALGLATTIGLPPLAFSQPADSASVAEQYLLAAANQERAARGLPQLHRDAQLARAAAGHARAMAQHESISHQFPGESDLSRRGASAGVPFSAISENVAEAPNAVQIHDLWMQSEQHRANLLDAGVDSVGISVIPRNGELYAVEDFARTVRDVSLGEQEAAIARLLAEYGKIEITSDPDRIAAARKDCAMSTGDAVTIRPRFVMRFTSDSLTRLPDQLTSQMASGHYRLAAVGACPSPREIPFTSYNFAVLLYP
jgi:hypothetical protein